MKDKYLEKLLALVPSAEEETKPNYRNSSVFISPYSMALHVEMKDLSGQNNDD